MSHYLYKLYVDDECIYVGITNNVKRRLKEHKSKGFNSYRVVVCDDIIQANRMERHLVGTINPKYNSHYRTEPSVYTDEMKPIALEGESPMFALILDMRYEFAEFIKTNFDYIQDGKKFFIHTADEKDIRNAIRSKLFD